MGGEGRLRTLLVDLPGAFRQWVGLCQNRAFQFLQPEKIYSSFRVCHIHFTDQDITRNNILNKTAVPRLHFHLPLGKLQ